MQVCHVPSRSTKVLMRCMVSPSSTGVAFHPSWSSQMSGSPCVTQSTNFSFFKHRLDSTVSNSVAVTVTGCGRAARSIDDTTQRYSPLRTVSSYRWQIQIHCRCSEHKLPCTLQYLCCQSFLSSRPCKDAEHRSVVVDEVRCLFCQVNGKALCDQFLLRTNPTHCLLIHLTLLQTPFLS